MFPFAGARSSVIEARRFYSLFDSASAGKPVGTKRRCSTDSVRTALNADTTNHVPSTAALQFITDPAAMPRLRPSWRIFSASSCATWSLERLIPMRFFHLRFPA